jgi:tetratricopeptide (TPR) repeat protein
LGKYKGVTFGNLNQYENAMKAFDKAIENDHYNLLALNNKKVTWNNKGDSLSK